MTHEEFFHDLDEAVIEAAITHMASEQREAAGSLLHPLPDDHPAIRLRHAMLGVFTNACDQFGPKVALDSIICLAFRLGAAYARLAASRVDA